MIPRWRYFKTTYRQEIITDNNSAACCVQRAKFCKYSFNKYKCKMCVGCVKVKCPDRGSLCLENGSYLFNFQECTSCHSRQVIKILNKHTDTEEDGEETVMYHHVCAVCEHLIAEHQYEFRIDGEYQEYSMVCILCGRAQDTRSIMPADPGKQMHLF